MASAPSTFTTFMRITGPSFLTGPEMIVNEAVKQTYFLGRVLRGSDMSRTLQGGTDIRDTVMFDEQSSFQFYHPNETFTPSNPQVHQNWQVYWRRGVDHMSWEDGEIELQVPEGLTSATRHQVYKRIKYAKEQRLWTSMLNGMENALWAVPQAADMEAQDGKNPYSIPAHVNEWGYGLFYNRTGGGFGTAWTTKQGIDPTLESRWIPKPYGALPAAGFTGMTTPTGIYRTRYNTVEERGPDGSLTAPGTQTLMEAFDQAWSLVNFVPPPTKSEYFENPSMYKQVICASLHGVNRYKSHVRYSQDQFTTPSRQDPAVVNPQYAGIDVIRIASLDDAALYPHATPATAPVAELSSSAEDVGPRFYFINGNYLQPTFHTRRYMEKHEPMRHRDQPFTSVQYCDTWYNVPARSMQRHTIVGPAGDMSAV